MPDLATQHVPGLDVLVAGAAMDPKWRDATTEVKVVNSLTLPDMAVVKLTDPQGEAIDHHPMKIGTSIEIKSAAADSQATTSIFKGEVAAIEPEFTQKGVTIVVRAYDRAHRMNRTRNTKTRQQMSASDMIRSLLGPNGLAAGDIKSTDVVHEFFQQSNETDWDFAWRLALMHDFEVVVDDTKLHFRPANKGQGSPIMLTWQENLLSFRPRMSGVQQPVSVNVRAWDPKSKSNVSGTAGNPETTSQAGVQRSKVAKDLGGGTTAVTDRVAATNAEANALAKSTIQRLADAFYEAEGVAYGNPKLKAGNKVKIGNVGQSFAGTFTLSSTTHVYRGGSGYMTQFQISGRSSRTLLELMRQPKQRDWSTQLVVGVVTNNNDPESMGRVRVKYPSLSDTEEGNWARVATPSSGKERGLLMLPQSGEEVIVGFEHGDARRPIVVGSVFNGKDKPGDELIQNKDGSLGVVSNEKIHMHSKKDFEIKSDQNIVIEIKQDVKETVSGSFKSEVTGQGNLKAQQFTIEAGATMTIKGANISVESSGPLALKGATVDIQGSGPVNIKGAIINLG